VANVAMEMGKLKVWRLQEQVPYPCDPYRGDVYATVYRDKIRHSIYESITALL
jgi:starvation-inducible outer membrane lipoprotein